MRSGDENIKVELAFFDFSNGAVGGDFDFFGFTGRVGKVNFDFGETLFEIEVEGDGGVKLGDIDFLEEFDGFFGLIEFVFVDLSAGGLDFFAVAEEVAFVDRPLGTIGFGAFFRSFRLDFFLFKFNFFTGGIFVSDFFKAFVTNAFNSQNFAIGHLRKFFGVNASLAQSFSGTSGKIGIDSFPVNSC